MKPCDVVPGRIQSHFYDHQLEYTIAAAVVGAAVGTVLGYKISKKAGWTFTGINYKPQTINLEAVRSYCEYDAELAGSLFAGVPDVSQMVGRVNLRPETISDLLLSGWSYQETLNEPGVWISPLAKLVNIKEN